jgi:protein SCO1
MARLPTYGVLVSSAPRRPRAAARPVVALVLAITAALLSGCGGSASGSEPSPSNASGQAHDHGPAPAVVSGAEDRYAGLDLAEPYRRPTFTLTDTEGRPYDFRSQTSGRATLLFFGYTQCPDVCPTTLADIAVALRGVDRAVAERVQVVFVTTDAKNDTPAVLAEYLRRFDADLPTRFIGLTGDQAAIDQAQLSAGVPQAEDNGRLHSSLLLLYGSDDEAHVAFDAGNTARDIAHDLEIVAVGS